MVTEKCNIRFFDKEINFKGEVSKFTSLIFVQKWSGVGEFTLVMDNYNKKLFKKGWIIMINKDPKKIGIIQSIHSIKGKTKKVTIKGFQLKVILSDRITIPPEGKDTDCYNDSIENIIYSLVDKNAINPSEINRKYPKLENKNSLGRGYKINFDSRYKYLNEEIESLCKINKFGWDVYIDLKNKKYIFQVLKGINKTTAQNIISPILFSQKFNNFFDIDYITSDIGVKNCGYVAGQGEGADRSVLIIDNELTGFDRKELFIDARDVDDKSNLEDRGRLKLAETKEIDVLTGVVKTSKYNVSWNLGDFITLVDEEFGILKHTQISQIVEIYEGGKITIEPTFGESVVLPYEKIKQITNGPLNEKNKTILAETAPKNVAKGTVWLNPVEVAFAEVLPIENINCREDV